MPTEFVLGLLMDCAKGFETVVPPYLRVLLIEFIKGGD
jgi:hypothetical protein